MFTGSTKLPPTKTPQPERLDEVYAALRRGLQSYLQVHQLELDSLGQQIRENKRNGRLGSLYELDKQVKAIERFMRRLEFHLSKVEELYDAYCIQRRVRDGASKMVAAFNSATGSREARESLSEANKGYRECTEHMCSLESELESQMGEFHVKMKGLAGFARLCAGDQYEVLMRYGRQRWRLRGRVEVSNKQMWDSEEYVFLPLVTELLSIKVTELKSLANHVVVGSVSCEMLDLFCPLPQTLAVDINDLGTVKLNLEVTWSPFDKDDHQTTSCSTVSKRLLSNQSPPDTPSMREQVFYSAPRTGPRLCHSLVEAFPSVTADGASSLRWEFSRVKPGCMPSQPSLLKRQGEMENGTVWSNSSESSDDSSSPAMAHQRLTASNVLQTPVAAPLSLTPHKSSASTPSLSSNQEEDEMEGGDVFPPTDVVPNGHVRTSCVHSLAGESGSDCGLTDRASVRSEDFSEASAELSCSCPNESSGPPVSLETTGVSVTDAEDNPPEDSSRCSDTQAEDAAAEASAGRQVEQSQPHLPVQKLKQPGDTPTAPFPTSASFTQEVETALESFDFLNYSDLDEEEEKELEEEEKHSEKHEEDQPTIDREEIEEEEKKVENVYPGGSDEEEGDALEILMEAPEGFRNSDEDCCSDSQESNVDDAPDFSQVVIPGEKEEINEEKGDTQHGDET